MKRTNGLAFEHYCVRYHAETYKHNAWHQKAIPEDELFASGFIHDFNQHRLKRIASHRALKGKAGSLYSDYGIDFLAKESSEVYHVGQCKHYTSKRVSANDLGTFLLKCGDLREKQHGKGMGYIYTTSPLQVDLHESLLNQSSKYTHIRLAFQEEPEQCKDMDMLDEKQIECEYLLRDYQRRAIDVILKELSEPLPPLEINDSEHNGIMENENDSDSVNDEDSDVSWDEVPHHRLVLEMACGLGKTVIAGHILKAHRPRMIVSLAPLKVSVEQLQTRIMPFLDGYKSLLIDSDVDGTTDVAVIREFLTKHENGAIALFTTYASAENIFAKGNIEFEDAFVLVDEVHNLLGNDELCNWINRAFRQGLLMSATIPEELYESIQCVKVFSYGIAEGIRDSFLCDYEVCLPYATVKTDEKEYVYECERELQACAKELDPTLTAKAIFLATGMLQKGARRCVLYMTSVEECKAFAIVLSKIFGEYHGLSCWVQTLVNTTKPANRIKILKDFQFASSHDIYLLLSVRILDEAIDLPRCDSEFISQVGEHTSDIRTVQRLMRGGRLDPMNPSKKNHLFMWTDDVCKAIPALQWLRNSDTYEFHKKIRVISRDYDSQQDPQLMIAHTAKESSVQRIVEMRCLTVDELWEQRRQEWIACFERLGRQPRCYSNESEERRAANWQSKMRYMKKKGKLNQERVDILTNTCGWEWDNNALRLEKAYALIEFVNREKRVPKQKEFVDGVKLGLFWHNVKQGKNAKIYQDILSHNETLREDYEKLHRLKDSKKGIEEITPEQKANLLIEFVNREKRVPKQKEFVDDVKLGRFWNGIQQGMNAKIYQDILSHNELFREDYERVQRLKATKKTQSHKTAMVG
jgi:superfamily II DNA or RNA helicase